MRRGMGRVSVVLAVVALLAAACTREEPEAQGGGGEGQGQAAGGLLQEIQGRGTVRCGVNNAVPGFGFETAEGQIEGFDVDFCKAIAAALFGTDDPQEGEHYELFPVDTEQRFSQLRAGRYDVLVRNTTWTSSRDGTEGVAFAHPNYYDGQAMMVEQGQYSNIEELDGAPICVLAGTTTELNLADYFQSRNLDFEPIVLEDNDQMLQAFRQGRCEGWTSDRSQLAGIQDQFGDQLGGLVIFDDVMSKEPLAPAVLDGDQEWAAAVDWVVNGIILAEEIGVDSGNVQQEAEDPSTPGIASMLGVPFGEAEDVTFEHGLGLDDTFMQNVLVAVGNYAEIYERHLEPIGLERGINALWTDGGIQYAMPFR